MSYENTAVVAVDSEMYGVVDWGEFDQYITETTIETDTTYYRFDWGTGVFDAVEYFLAHIAKREDNFILSETFGIVILGEEEDNIDTHGEPWEYGLFLDRSIVIEYTPSWRCL